MKVQPSLSATGDGLFDLSLYALYIDDVAFEIIEMTAEEIRKLLKDIGDQLSLLEEAEG